MTVIHIRYPLRSIRYPLRITGRLSRRKTEAVFKTASV